VDKSRYAIFDEGSEYEFTPKLCEQLREYLNEGASPEELLEQQHKEFVEGVTKYLDANKQKVNVWKLLKEQNGLQDIALKDIPLPALKTMFTQLTV
jgi:septum formation topological specificity factor MinE